MGRTIRASHKAHCLVVPYPAQGHINPMLQFSKRLAVHKEIKLTLALTNYMLMNGVADSTAVNSIAIEPISDGKEEGGELDFKDYIEKFERVGSQTLTELIEKQHQLGCPIDCIIYDAFMPWVLDVAKKFGLYGAVFFTQTCAVNNIYYHVHKGLLKLPLTTGGESNVLIPGLPPLQNLDMPSFIYVVDSYPGTLEMLGNQFSNIDEADWVLVNTFHKLEEEVVDWMEKLWPLKTIGPTIPSMYLDKRLDGDKEYGLNIHNMKISDCVKWLDERPVASVVYVSFGTIAELGGEQMEELAWGLKDSNKYFLWVVRASEIAKLPESFVKETMEKGLVVPWCQQLEILAHKSIGCFITHCGWNSTLEAISLGVPVVAMPQWTDQSTNAKYVTDVWGNGLNVQMNEEEEDGVVIGREEVVRCMREVMEGEKGKEIRRNAFKWMELAREAVDEGGSSDRNINDFVSKLIHSS